jgi:hypothetical protein
MGITLADIRAKLQQQDTKQASSNMDSAVYPHWNIAEGETATLRFLPDADPKNTFFWIERSLIRLPFAGVIGQPESRPVTVQVPCMEMWNEACPVLAEVRTWFKDKSLEEMGRKYWKKRSYLFQGFVRKNPMSDDTTPENPIRRFVISPQLFALVKAALMDPELENLPTDYSSGLDFQVVKTSKGGYADYSTSKWSRKETALTQTELAAIEQHGLYNLADFLPKKPNEIELRVIKEMFEASVDGQPFDMARWGNYYKPLGMSGSGSASATSAASDQVAKPAPQRPASVATPVAEAAADTGDAAPWDSDADTGSVAATASEAPSASGNSRADDILKMIRSRQKQQ